MKLCEIIAVEGDVVRVAINKVMHETAKPKGGGEYKKDDKARYEIDRGHIVLCDKPLCYHPGMKVGVRVSVSGGIMDLGPIKTTEKGVNFRPIVVKTDDGIFVTMVLWRQHTKYSLKLGAHISVVGITKEGFTEMNSLEVNIWDILNVTPTW
jgi:hypothetical protein